jgi:hypothetical protein
MMEGSRSVQIMMDPDPDLGGPKTYGSRGGSETLLLTTHIFLVVFISNFYYGLVKERNHGIITLVTTISLVLEVLTKIF